ncbi:tetratricopeptide repeat-containing sensor histidine kinase [Reichenbachiella sp. MALMAid0571]|uniref:tetratricopeptide repeat-containing sensor histidine kinase n=1 Tax=Reichenbachiella sp. MALMAid0571 TaxID=3143939 RepID=UPI0032DF42DE
MKFTLLKAYLFIGFSIYTVSAQNQRKADSLRVVLQENDFKDSLKYELYIDLSIYSANPDDIIEAATKARQLAIKNKKEKWKAISDLTLGDGYRFKGDLVKAIEYYMECASYTLDTKEDGIRANAYNNIGNLYMIQNNFKHAISYLKKAQTIYQDRRDTTKLASALLNIGEAFRLYHHLDSASIYFQKTMELVNASDSDLLYAYCLGNIGLVNAELEKSDLAEQQINEAIEILEKLGDYYPIAVYEMELADIFKAKGELYKAQEFLMSSYRVSKKQGLKEQIRDAGLKLSKYFQEAKDYEKAYFYQNEYIAYRDSINSEETIMKIADLRTEFEVSKKQIEVNLLNKEAQKQRVFLISLAVILLLVMILTYVLFKIYKIKLKANRILAKQKEEIEIQRNQLDALNSTKDKFFSIVSHDLRGPVNNFQGISEILKQMVQEKEFDTVEALTGKLEKSARQLSILLDNLLGWALGQQGQFPYNPEKLIISDIFDSTLKILENMAVAKRQSLTFVIKEKCFAWADKDSALAILRNLIGNAIKFTPEGGNISFSAEKSRDMVLIKVIDSGLGMSGEKIAGIFNFESNKSSWGTDGEKGMGLGLTLVHQLVEMNHGKIEVESKEGEGTTFSVWLPLFVEDSHSVSLQSE